MDWVRVADSASTAFELIGLAIIVGGFLFALARAAGVWRADGLSQAYEALRATFGRSVLLGLEVLVAADIIRTVAVEPTLSNLVVLGLLVVIRTFLSWSLEVEIEGRWPWQRVRDTRGTEERGR